MTSNPDFKITILLTSNYSKMQQDIEDVFQFESSVRFPSRLL